MSCSNNKQLNIFLQQQRVDRSWFQLPWTHCALYLYQKKERTPLTQKIKSQLKKYISLLKEEKFQGKKFQNIRSWVQWAAKIPDELLRWDIRSKYEEKNDIFWIWSGIERYRQRRRFFLVSSIYAWLRIINTFWDAVFFLLFWSLLWEIVLKKIVDQKEKCSVRIRMMYRSGNWLQETMFFIYCINCLRMKCFLASA